MKVVVAGCSFDADLADPEQLLARHHSTTAWGNAVAAAGADAVCVVQRFKRSATFRRGRVDYRLIADDGPGFVPPWRWNARLALEVRSQQPDVVHVDGLVFPAMVRCLRLALPPRVAIVVQDHGGLRWHARGLRRVGQRLFYRIGLAAVDAFMFTTREQAAPWQAAGVIRDRQPVYEVLESSTDMASWPLSPDAKTGLPGSPAMLWVGRLDSNKDPLTVLEGFAQAAATLPEAALTLVYGDDLLLPAIKDWIAARPNLQPRVHLRGRVDREALPAFYDAADIFMLGSHREVACFSLLEALSFGVTPVITDIPAFRAITGGGRVGALFTPGDPAEAARAILRAVGSGERQARRSLVRAHFESQLSWPVVGAQAFAAYRRAANARQELA